MLNKEEIEQIRKEVFSNLSPLMTLNETPVALASYGELLTDVVRNSFLISKNVETLNKSLESTSGVLLSGISQLITLQKLVPPSKEEYDKREKTFEIKKQQVEAVQVKAEKPSDDRNISDILKTLFKNPVFATAVAAALYQIIPKDRQEQIKAFFSNFYESIKNVLPELENLNTALKVAGIALAAFFGVKLIASTAAALAGLVQLITVLTRTPGRLVKKITGLSGLSKAALLTGAGGLAYLATREEAQEKMGGIAAQVGKILETKKEAVPVEELPPGPEQRKEQQPSVSSTGPIEQPRPVVSKIAKTKIKKDNRSLIIEELNRAGITDSKSQSNILAQVEKESGFIPKEEQISSYSGKRLFELFGVGNKSGNTPKFKTEEEANELASKGPQAVAEILYGNRADLGNVDPGDGWKYRGRGFIQITGRSAYRNIGQLLGIDLEGNPDLANNKEIAAKVVPIFYLKYKGIKPEDLRSIETVTKATGAADIKSREERKNIAQALEKELKSQPQVQTAAAETNLPMAVPVEKEKEPPVKIEQNTVVVENKAPAYSPELAQQAILQPLKELSKVLPQAVDTGKQSMMEGMGLLGGVIDKLSQETQIPDTKTTVNNVSSSNPPIEIGKNKVNASNPIPSPVASRGSLDYNVRHGTAAVPAS